ncbi:hypothetical protein BCR35DRAFT_323308 [Leucosporidium creatinivorum]|uniref:PB1 domain-containing protein n=1 Tax=Leucosporidium creatinivorum TaxID=106004 RepID=A0A1Y2G282_9BASI|nr:hypothetical protein BCR35DRAFT_323308 [Leucosporidium creatinivorum]
MAPLVLKITQTVQGSTPITRRVPFTPSASNDNWSRVATTIQERFALEQDEPLALLYKDTEGDLITISSSVEFQEVLHSLDESTTTTLRFEIAQQSAAASYYAPSSFTSSCISDSAGPHDLAQTNTSSSFVEPNTSQSLFDGFVRSLNDVTLAADLKLQESTGLGDGVASPSDSLVHVVEDQFEQIEFFSEGSDTEEEEDGASVSDTTYVQRIEGKGKEREGELEGAESSSQRAQDLGFADEDSDEEDYKSLATATVGIDSVVDGKGSPSAAEAYEDPQDDVLPTSPLAPAHATASDDPPEAALPSTTSADAERGHAQQPPFGGNSGLPPSLTAFLTSLPTHAEALSTNLSTFLNNPTSDTLSALLAVPSAPLGQIPTVARGIQSEVQAAVSELVGSVRREAQGLQEEFERIQREVKSERERLKEEMRRAREESGATGEKEENEENEKESTATAEPAAQQEEPAPAPSAGAAVAVEVDDMSESARLAAQKLEEAREEVRRVAREMRRKEREARKAREHQARHSRRSSKASKVELKEAIKAAGDEAAPALDDSTASVDAPIVEASRPTPSTSPASEFVARPEDDMYHRRISMPGSFAPTPTPIPPVAPLPPFVSRLPSASRQPPTSPSSTSAQPILRSIPSRLPPNTSTSAPSFRPLSVPGSFPTSSRNTAPHPPPVASTSTLPDDGEWAEVTPTQLKKQLAELGFDLKDIGTRIAAERVWEAKRGKSLGEMVDAVVEMLVKRAE